MLKRIELKQANSEENRQFEIEYNKDNEPEVLKIEAMINNNQYIFSDLFKDLNKISYLSSNDDQTLYISSIADLKEFLSKKLESIKGELIKPLLDENANAAKTLFLRTVLMGLYSELGIDFELPSESSEFSQHVNAVYVVLAAKYYDEKDEPEKLIEYIMNPDNEKKQELLLWLNDTHRFDLLNMLLNEQYQILIKLDGEEEVRDSLLNNHLDAIIEIIERDFQLAPLAEQEITYTYPSLSQEELHKMCQEFFKKIDPTGNWLEKYERYHQEVIVYGEKDPATTIDWCNFKDGNDYIIIAPLNHTISDFRDLVHEISHIVSLEQLTEGETISPSLLEFPAIFMELQAIKFLRQKGYPQELLDALYIERNTWTAYNTITIAPILRTLSRYLKNGPISLKGEQEYSLSLVDDIEQLTEEDRNLLNYYFPFQETRIMELCDEKNDFLIMHPDAVLRQYPYTIGKFLAVKSMDKELEEPQTLSTVLSIIENLKNETPEGVIEKLKLNVTELQEEKPIQYKKES